METTNNERKEEFLKKRNEARRMETKESIKIGLEELKRTADYLAEVNVLKMTPRSGWRFAGPPVKTIPDYVAGHVAIVAQLAYILARMEGLKNLEALKSIALAVFHDNNETRLGDKDKVAAYYLKTSRHIFSDAVKDQLSNLPKEIGCEILKLVIEANFGESPEAIIARDADILEASTQARIFNERGFIIPEDILKKYLDEKRVRTRSAKRLMSVIKQKKKISVSWWKDLELEL